MQQTDVLIIGCGIAGCTTAVELAKQGIEVTLVTATDEPRDSSSFNAQEGISFAQSDDSHELLKHDMLRVGGDLVNPRALDQLVEEGPGAIRDLLLDDLEVSFDTSPDGALKLEQAPLHSAPRLLHASDHVGKVVIDAMLRRVADLPNVNLLTGRTAIDLITLAQHSQKLSDIYKKPTCTGAYLLNNSTGEVEAWLAKETILATGGVGELFLHSTNSPQARGDGVAMAHRAGARLMNLEYLQFHPTALYIPNERRRLLTDMIASPGAQLLSHRGNPFLQADSQTGMFEDPTGLARNIYQEMLRSGTEHVWLDVTQCDKSQLIERMPNVVDYCQSRGFDIAKDPLPVVPAAHYMCGGIAVDKHGQSSVDRLRAVGEVTCTGTHGAARLPSIGLLESLVWGRAAARDVSKQISKFAYYFPKVQEWKQGNQGVNSALLHQDWTSLKQAMWNYVGPVRGVNRLRRAIHQIRDLHSENEEFFQQARVTPELVGLRNALQTGVLMAESAAHNRHSLGCHYCEV